MKKNFIITKRNDYTFVVKFFNYPTPEEFDEIWAYITPDETDVLDLTIIYPIKDGMDTINEEYIFDSVEIASHEQEWRSTEKEYHKDGMVEHYYEIKPLSVELVRKHFDGNIMTKEFRIILEEEHVDSDFVPAEDIINPY